MMNFKIWLENTGEIIAYHATRAKFNLFDIKFAKDELGMRMGEGYGHNKFYFAKNKEQAWPQAGKDSAKLITVSLFVTKPYSGKEYSNKLKEYQTYLKMSREKAVNTLDQELQQEGFDCIDDGWQIAVFDPSKIKIINVENWERPK